MKYSLAATTLIALLMALGCGGSSAPDEAYGRPVVLGERTQVFPAAGADQIAVEPDRLIFPAKGNEALLKKAAGDILVGDKGSAGSANKAGFLRKVSSVTQQGDKIVVVTERAILPEAIKDGAFKVQLQIPSLGPTGPVWTPGELAGLNPQGGPKNLLKFEGIVLFDENLSVDVGGQQVGFHTWAKTSKGSLDFTPKFDVGADISGFKLKEFHAIATGTLDAVIEFDIGLELASTLDGDTLAMLIAQSITKKPSKTLFEYPIDLGSLNVGPLPLPSSADFRVDLDCEFIWTGGAKVLVGAEGQAVITAGIKYLNGDISGVFDKSVSMHPTGPNWTLDGTVKVRCDLKPSFELKLFGIASGKIWGDAYGELDAKVECGSGQLTGKVSGEAFAGARAGVEAKVDVFGLYKWKKACTLFDWESAHAQASGTFTLPGGQGGTCSPDTSELQHPEPAMPEKCFSSGGGTGGSGGSGAAGSGGSAEDGGVQDAEPCTKKLTPPDVWTCEPERYGDCVCDCTCGADDDDCKTGECEGCSHDECTTGEPLGFKCSPCIEKICAEDSYCCDVAWDGACVLDAEDYCGMTCG